MKNDVEFLSLRQSGSMTAPIKDVQKNKSDSNTVGIWNHQTDKTISFIYKFSSLPGWRIWWEYEFSNWIHENVPCATEFFVKSQSPRAETLLWDQSLKRCKPEFFDPLNVRWPKTLGKPIYLFLQQRLRGVSLNKYWDSLPTKHDDLTSWTIIFFNVLDTMCQTQLCQDLFNFTHYDMHLGNIYCVPSSYRWFWYRLDDDGKDIDILLPSFGMERVWIDYEFSYHKGMKESKLNYSFHLMNWGVLPGTFSSFADMARFTTCAWSHCAKLFPKMESHFKQVQQLFKANILSFFNVNDKCPLSFTKLGVMIFHDHIRHFVLTKLKLLISTPLCTTIEPIYYTIIALLFHHVKVADFQNAKPMKTDDPKTELEQLVKFFVLLSKRPNLDQGNTLINDLFTFQKLVETSWPPLLAEWKFHCDANEKDLLKWRDELVVAWNPSISCAFKLYAQWTKELQCKIQCFEPAKPLRMIEWMMKICQQKNINLVYKSLRIEDSIRFIGWDSSSVEKTTLQDQGWSQKQLDLFVQQSNLNPLEFTEKLLQKSFHLLSKKT